MKFTISFDFDCSPFAAKILEESLKILDSSNYKEFLETRLKACALAYTKADLGNDFEAKEWSLELMNIYDRLSKAYRAFERG